MLRVTRSHTEVDGLIQTEFVRISCDEDGAPIPQQNFSITFEQIIHNITVRQPTRIHITTVDDGYINFSLSLNPGEEFHLEIDYSLNKVIASIVIR